MPRLSELIADYVLSGFPGIWIRTDEPDEAIHEICALAEQRKPKLFVASWDLGRGLTLYRGNKYRIDPTDDEQNNVEQADPIGFLKTMDKLNQHDPETRENVKLLVVLPGFHRLLEGNDLLAAGVVQTLATRLIDTKKQDRNIIVLAPTVNIPPDLQRLFVTVDHPLPTPEEILKIAQGLDPNNKQLTDPDFRDRLVAASSGLIRMEVENACALSLRRNENSFDPKDIFDYKANSVRKSGVLSVYEGGEDFSSIGGMESAKDFCRKALLRSNKNPKSRPKGALFLGPPGTGKSAFAKALGKETGRPTIIMDVGALMGSLLGQTEQNMRQALRTIDAMSPCVVMIDEVEKALSGADSGGQSDGGVMNRLMGTLLTWLNDHESDVFAIVTCNNIRKLPPEFSRAERFDRLFFADLPGRPEKDRIWQIYREYFEIPKKDKTPDDLNWTGAEIKSCCRKAAMLGVSLETEAREIVPVARTSAEIIGSLREWAKNRCVDANHGGMYQGYQETPVATKETRRRVDLN